MPKSGSILTGTYANGVSLTDPLANPVTVASAGSISSTLNGVALYGGSKSGQPDYHFPWSITNFGRIAAAGPLSTGVLLEGGGTIDNHLGGLISGGRQGVSVAHQAGAVTNSGSITATGTDSTGVFLHAGGTVTNLGSIGGVKAGVQITGATGSVANYGTVRGTGSILTYGVVLSATVGNFLTNGRTGYIGSTAGVGVGVFSTAGPAAIVNSGTIENGVILQHGGSVANGQSGSAGGVIGNIFGINISGGPGTVVNYGAINFARIGVELTGGGSVRNAQNITTGANGYFGVIVTGASGAVANLGSIVAAGTNGGAAVLLNAGGAVSNGAPSATTALIRDDAAAKDIGIEIDGVAGTVANYGSVSGSYGIMLRAGGTVGNAGSAASVTGQYIGIVVSTGAGSVANFGTVKAVGASTNPGFGSIGVRLGGGIVTNGSGAVTTATIEADESGSGGADIQGIGVDIDAFGTLENYGTVKGTDIGSNLFLGGKIANGAGGATAALVSGGNFGLSIGGAGTAASSVANFGTIDATAIGGIGISLANPLSNTVANSGTITGAGGTAVAFGGGGDRLVVNPGAVFNGIVLGGGGSNEIDFNKTGAVGLDPEYVGFSIVRLGNGGADSLTLTEADFAGLAGSAITVHGGNIADTVDASALASGHRLSYFGGAGRDKVTGGAGADAFSFAAAALTANDIIAGGGGSDTVEVTTGGAVDTSGVSGVETFRLASAGADTLALTDANFSGVAGGVITVVGGSAGAAVDASALSAANRVVMFGGAGTDRFTGGAANDRFSFAAAALTAADRIAGGGGVDELAVSTAGIAAASGVTGVEVFRLPNAGAGAIVLVDGNFTGIAGSLITVIGGSSGNIVIAEAVSAPHRVEYIGGAGPDLLLDGDGDGIFEFAAANLTTADLVQGAGGADQLVLTTGGDAQLDGVSGVETIRLASAGANSIALDDGNFRGTTGSAITVVAAGAGGTVNAANVSAANRVIFVGGAGADVFTGGAGADAFSFTAATLGGADQLTGGGGVDRLALGSAGAIAAARVRGIETFSLSSAGANTLVLSAANFVGLTGSTITVFGGGAGNNLTAALPAADKVALHGGAGSDAFNLSPTTLAGATVTGGLGSDRLNLTSAGTVAAGGVSGVETYRLANGGANSLTLANANFAGVTGGAIAVFGGDGGNTIDASKLSPANRASLIGGAGADRLTAGPHAALTGGGGADLFVLSTPGTTASPDSDTIADFAHLGDKLAFSNAGFALGRSGAAATPAPLPSGLFVSNATGVFTASTQRFAYDSANGKLFYSATGATAGEHLFVTLANHAAITTADLFFVT